MSVTVSDLLRLPSLRQAKVIAGRGGLSKIVTSVSVLESTDPGVLVDEVFPQDEYFGGEIVITGFLNMRDDVELQYKNMERLIEGGEIGLILYYVGVYLKEVDPRLIRLADERDFVLIVMPEKDVTLRYGEVICDVTELIHRDRSSDHSIVSEVLAQVSVLPACQRTISTILKMLRDRLQASVVLCDRSLNILNLATWPRNLEGVIKSGLEGLEGLPASQQSAEFPALPGSRIYRFTILSDRGQDMEFFVIKEGIQPGADALAQSADVVRLGASIWGQEKSEVAARELIRAIIQDDPIKMRRLAELFHINVADIHEMWIFRCPEGQRERFRREGLDRIRKYLDHYCRTVVADLYEGDAVAFLDWIEHSPDRGQIAAQLRGQLQDEGFQVVVTRCAPLADTAEVREAFLMHQENLGAARRIWPGRGVLTLAELGFAADCHRLTAQGENALEAALRPLKIFADVHEADALKRTLAAYLLDAGSNVADCAELLYLHKNTVKYRLNRIRELAGYPLNKYPEVFSLYRAAALDRLTSD